jgi:ABC-type nitrate/sulfonate/bicarbonate transport system ATPase subunit
MKTLLIKELYKSFTVNGQNLSVLEDINLTITGNEFIVIVGHSGCGKSTLLKIIAGLHRQDRGVCSIDGAPITRPGSDRGMIFQEHRLLPWLNIEQNVTLGLAKLSKAQRVDAAKDYLNMVKLNGFEKAYPAQLSGGMSQRAAIARALIAKPEILLLDEPFGSLDALTKIEMQNEILNIRAQQKTMMVMVTHDIDEAVFLADRVIIMSDRPGRIVDIVKIELPENRDRGSADFSWYKQKIFKHFFSSNREDKQDFNI